MSLDLRHELDDAAAAASPPGTLVADARQAGQRRLRARRRRTVIGTAAALVAVAVGIGVLPRPWTQSTSPVSGDTAQFDGRFDDLNLYADSLRQAGDPSVWAAREHLVTLCLQAAGITYQPSPYPGAPVAHSRYTYPAPDAVARLGYDAPGLSTADYGAGMASPNPSTGTPTSIPESQLKARDTCNQQAIVWLEQKPVDDIRNSIDQQNQTLMAAVLASPAYTAAVTAWSTCMNDAGHPFDSPAQARAYADTVRGTAAGQPTQAAIDIAVADYACEHQVHLLEILHNELAAAVSDWIAGHAPLLDQYETAIRIMDNKVRTQFG